MIKNKLLVAYWDTFVILVFGKCAFQKKAQKRKKYLFVLYHLMSLNDDINNDV